LKFQGECRRPPLETGTTGYRSVPGEGRPTGQGTKEISMKRLIVLAGAFVLVCGVSGCGGDTHESVIKDTIDVLKKTARELRNIRKAAEPKKGDDVAARKKRVLEAAESSAKELRKLGEQLQDLNRRAVALKDTLSKDEKARIDKAWKDKFQEAVKEVNDAWEQLKKLKIGSVDVGPEVVATLKDKGALDGFNLNS
jgi:hypothetical protein